jgi:hypothetical protein
MPTPPDRASGVDHRRMGRGRTPGNGFSHFYLFFSQGTTDKRRSMSC